MRFAIIDNKRVDAQPSLNGICPFCSQPVIAKCGDKKEWHWAHRSIKNCDSWWETETEWHRNWKNNFPLEWQEKVFFEENTNEKHIADVCTTQNLVIEFQHSYIDPKERNKREAFYKKMVWVVDGTRLTRDSPRFLKGKEEFRPTKEPGKYLVDFPDECFPSVWIGCSVPVIFDFKGVLTDNNLNDWRNYIYCLFPTMKTRESIVAILTRDSFVKNIIDGKWFHQQQETKSSTTINQTKASTIINQRPSEFIYDRGRFVKRRRL